MHQQPGSQVIPIDLVGIAPVTPHTTVVDNYGYQWSLPGAPPAPGPSGEPPLTPPTTRPEQEEPPRTLVPADAVPPALAARSVAVEMLHEVPLPSLQVRMSPAVGLVALPSWYWLEGATGATESSRTVELPPLVGPDVPFSVVPAADPRRTGVVLRIDVRVWPVRYTWAFGDGASLTTHSSGRRYPEQSEVQHVYERSSLQFPGGVPVRVDVEYAAEYRVNGGPPQGLPATSRTYTAAYRVQEIQTVLTRR